MPFSFKLLMFLLAMVASAFILIPVWRRIGEHTRAGLALPSGIAILVIGGALSLYAWNSEWNWSDNGLPDDPAMQTLYNMRKQVHDEPLNLAAWRQLGSFYLRYGQVNGAMEALGKAFELSGGQDIETNLALVEALAMTGGSSHMARAAELIDLTLKMKPTDRKALWFGGEIAFASGDTALALTRWQTLLAQTSQESSPEAQSVAQMLRQRIAGVSLAAESEGAGGDQAAMPAATQEAVQTPTATVAPAPETLKISVDLASEWRDRVAGNTTVFILVRPVGQPGPPLAVQRLTARALPTTVTLSDKNAMMPSRKLSDFEDVEVVARVSFSGTPTAKTGDYYGAARISADDPRTLRITIDTLQP